MINYTIIKEENTKWDEQKKMFFSEADENVFRLGKVPMNASSVDYIYWAAIDDAGEVLG